MDTRNHADQMVYQSEKTLSDMGDKVSPADKKSIEDAITNVRTALSGTDIQSIKNTTEELQKTFYAVSEKLYAGANPNAGQPGGDSAPGGNGDQAPGGGQYYDADYEVVDDEKK